MAKIAVEHTFTSSTIKYSDTYDSTKTVLGKWIVQNTGMNSYDKYAGPFPLTTNRPYDLLGLSVPASYPHVIDIGDNTHWVFLIEVSAAAATRRVACYRLTTTTQAWSFRGYITLTYPTATAHTVRGFRVQRHLYTTGTVAVSGTAVTGTSTAWQTALYAVGARIGFGSTDPNAITLWYYISAINSDTSITLSATAGTISAGTAFVIEELRIITSTTNATPANGGLFVAKGVNYDDFIVGGTTIAAATTTDNVKAVYWLGDAATVLNTAAGGLALGTVSDTSHIVYVINADAGTTLRIYKYDIRVALSGLAAGFSTSAFVLKTGQQTVTGTISQTNSSRLVTLSHGPGSGSSCLYLTTTTRIVRCLESGITNASTTFVSDSMTENPTGTTTTFPLTNAMSSVEYASSIDRLIISTNTSNKYYVSQYKTDGSAFDRVFTTNATTIDNGNVDYRQAYYPACSAILTFWEENGILYISKNNTASNLNQLYTVPCSVDWDYASTTNGRLISPSIATTNCYKFSRFAINQTFYIGTHPLALSLEPCRAYYRTSGITDNSGSWTLIDAAGDLSGASASETIQFMFEFRIFGPFMLPARIHGFTVSYDDLSTDSHFLPSSGLSDPLTKRFVFKFMKGFDTTVPTLTIKLYNAVSGSLIISDTTVASASGIWEKSIDNGVSWNSYDTTDKANDLTYIRYTPTTLSSAIRVKAILLQ